MASKLKLRVTARFLASIFDGIGTAVRKDGLATYVDLDYTQFGAPIGNVDPNSAVLLVYNLTTGVFNIATLGSLISSSKQITILTGVGALASPYAALPSDDVLIVKQTTGAPFTVTVDWASRVKPLRIVDGKGDANVNNITITPNTGQTQLSKVNYSYVINGIGGSIILTPLPDGSGGY